ncbi:MAG: manganese efflux pump MntP family protein [Treponema sp.]|nr:manganese efflux pump MntP family protein [Treponema sp.]
MTLDFSFAFLITNLLLGVGLAMDAFSVSIANALNEPDMRKTKVFGVAGTYAFFQFAMPMIGWICVHTIAEKFTAFQKFIPWIALILLLYIGGKMIIECIKERKEDNEDAGGENEKAGTILTFGTLMIQGIATSIDALSVGFTIAEYNAVTALGAGLIIAVVTLAICLAGLLIGKKIGEKLAGKAEIFGGIILIGIGIEIFVKGVFF